MECLLCLQTEKELKSPFIRIHCFPCRDCCSRAPVCRDCGIQYLELDKPNFQRSLIKKCLFCSQWTCPILFMDEKDAFTRIQTQCKICSEWLDSQTDLVIHLERHIQESQQRLQMIRELYVHETTFIQKMMHKLKEIQCNL